MINFLLNNTPLFYWTQSLWRDEAFSVWIAKDGVREVITRTSGDFNPPLYYLLLNVWMQVVGKSEIALRGLSIVAFLLFLLVVYTFALAVFKDKKGARFTVALMAVNPMLLYFAFELRMYSLLILFVAWSMYSLYTKNWKWYVIATTLGMYTQPFMAFVILSQNMYLALTGRIRTAIRNDFLIGLLYLPWLPTLLTQFKASGPMWMYPVDLNLIGAVLGNLYVGYEGTPGNLWPFMHFLSLLILLSAFGLWQVKQKRSTTLLWLTSIGVPLLFVLGVSLFKPIYVHRYVIFVTVAEVFLIASFLKYRLSSRLRWWVGGFLLCATFLSNFVAVSFHRKVPIRDTFYEINSLLKKTDVIYAETPLVFYEAVYYTKPDTQVFLYNPHLITPPRYVGSVGMPKEMWAASPPLFPQRAFVIKEDGSHYIVTTVTNN